MKIIRSNRKTLSLSIDREGQPVVRAPYGCSDAFILEFVQKHQGWIRKHQAAHRNHTEAEIAALRARAKAYLPGRVAYYAPLMGVRPTGVKITAARTRYGSCSPKNSLCFSLYLMEKSARAIDYVVVHELAHILRRDHSKHFYKIIEKTLPDYRERIKELKA